MLHCKRLSLTLTRAPFFSNFSIKDTLLPCFMRNVGQIKCSRFQSAEETKTTIPRKCTNFTFTFFTPQFK